MASPLRKLRARLLKAGFKAHTEIYERSDGRLGAWAGLPTLLLTVTGRKSGIARTTPLVYFEDRGRYVVVGSDGAARNDPQWWKNLKVNPSATVRVGRDKFPATASLATGDERARLVVELVGARRIARLCARAVRVRGERDHARDEPRRVSESAPRQGGDVR